MTEIKQGKVEGVRLAGGVEAYLGIPYAAAPTGEQRFRRPEPHAGWAGVYQATRTRGVAPQDDRDPDGFYQKEFPFVYGPKDEDCLNLNIWTPDAAGKLPVMLWIHGGAFNHGAGSDPVFNGEALARKGVVVVTINYRLGILGYLAHPALHAEAGTSGNYGLRDQVAALIWVRDNIAAFGGDPGRVTIFGQSAGGMSVVCLLAAPMARGLFHRAIVQSGSMSFAPGAKDYTYDDALAQGEQAMASIGARTADELRAAKVSDILTAQRGKRFAPVADWRVLPCNPAEMLRNADCARVPVMAGFTANEAGAGFMPGDVMPVEKYRESLRERYGERADEVFALYPAADDKQTIAMTMALQGDAFYLGTTKLADTLLPHGIAAYVYRFAMDPPGEDGAFHGAFHSSELAYEFGTLDALPRPWREKDYQLSETLMNAFVSFARTGKPTDCDCKWPLWLEQRTVMDFGETVGKADDARFDRARALAKLMG